MTASKPWVILPPLQAHGGIAPGNTILHDVVASCLVSFPKDEVRRDFRCGIGITYECCCTLPRTRLSPCIKKLAGEHEADG